MAYRIPMLQLGILTMIFTVLSTSVYEVNTLVEEDLDVQLEQMLSQAGGEKGKAYFEFPNLDDLSTIPQTPQNPLTPSKVALGRMLFFEPGLGTHVFNQQDKYTYSCATCHLPAQGFQSGIRQAIGAGGIGQGKDRKLQQDYIQKGKEHQIDIQLIRTPSALHTAYQEVLGWSGNMGSGSLNDDYQIHYDRATIEYVNNLGLPGIESLSIAALSAHKMGADQLIKTNHEYQVLFQKAFPDTPELLRFSKKNIGLALAAYQRTLMATEAPFQLWLKGDSQALTREEKLGAMLFFGKAKCVSCHSGVAFGNDHFYALGMSDLKNASGILIRENDLESIENNHLNRSLGRASFTRLEKDTYKFRVPQLYNLKDAPFYGHGGSFTSLDAILYYKNRAIPENDKVSKAQLAKGFSPLHLNDQEIQYITQFVSNALYDPMLDRYQPKRVPTGLQIPNGQ